MLSPDHPEAWSLLNICINQDASEQDRSNFSTRQADSVRKIRIKQGIVSVNLKNKSLASLLAKMDLFSGELQFRTCKLQQSHRPVQRRGWLFKRGKGQIGKPVLSKQSIGGNWEFYILWLLIGSVLTVFHWLGCCWVGVRKQKLPFLPLSSKAGFTTSWNLQLMSGRVWLQARVYNCCPRISMTSSFSKVALPNHTVSWS